MDTIIFTTKKYQDEVAKTAQKEAELSRLLNVKSEKICNNFLAKNLHTQLSYLTKEEQAGAIALPKGIILDKLLAYLRNI